MAFCGMLRSSPTTGRRALSTPETSHAQLTLPQALAPIVLLVSMLAASVFFFGSDASYGANQIALVLATMVAGKIVYQAPEFENQND